MISDHQNLKIVMRCVAFKAILSLSLSLSLKILRQSYKRNVTIGAARAFSHNLSQKERDDALPRRISCFRSNEFFARSLSGFYFFAAHNCCFQLLSLRFPAQGGVGLFVCGVLVRVVFCLLLWSCNNDLFTLFVSTC